MTAEQTNELEERRVIRLLAGLAAEVPALSDAEIQRAVGAASAPVRLRSGHRSRRPLRSFSGVAAAAVVALAFVVQFGAPAEHSSSASGSASIVTFPEGNALQLLLAARETR